MMYIVDGVKWLDVFFVKQKTANEMRISDWSSDVCSSDLPSAPGNLPRNLVRVERGDLGPPARGRTRSGVRHGRWGACAIPIALLDRVADLGGGARCRL